MNKNFSIAIFLFCYALDQVSKWAVLHWIARDIEIEVIPKFFYLVQVWNTGAAFGAMSGANTFFIFLTIAVLAGIAIMAWRGAFRGWLMTLAMILLAAGACGNLTDRILHGHVVDFLDFILPFYGHWPAFNVADSCIFIAAALLLISAFFDFHKKAQEA